MSSANTTLPEFADGRLNGPAEFTPRPWTLPHLPPTFTLQDKAERVRQHLAHGPPLTPEQMRNILRPIGNLPGGGKAAKNWPKLE